MTKLNQLLQDFLDTSKKSNEAEILEATQHKNDEEVSRLLQQLYHDWYVQPADMPNTPVSQLADRYEQWINEACK